MARVRVYNTQTGQWGTVSEQFANNPKFSTSAPQAPTQQKGFLENLIGSLISPFKNTIQRGVGAAQEIGLNRAGKLEEADRLMKEAQKRMMAGDTSSTVKQMLDTAEQLSRGAQQETVASRNQEVLTDPLQIAKDSAAMLSWGVPVGSASKALGGPLKNVGSLFPKIASKATTIGKGGAISGALGGFGYSDETDPGKLLGKAALGGITGYGTAKILNKLFPGKPVKTKEEIYEEMAKNPNMAEKIGLDLEKNVFRPQAGMGPESIVDENKIVLWANKNGIDVGDANNVRYGVNNVYQTNKVKVGEKINSITKTYSSKQLANRIRQEVVEKGTFYGGGVEEINALNREINLISKGGKNLSAKNIFDDINSIQSQANKAFDKLAGVGGGTIQNKVGVKLDVADVLHEVLDEMGGADIKPYLSEMSMAHKASKGLYIAAKENANLFGMAVPLVTPIAQTISNTTGKGILETSKFLRGVTTTTKPLLETLVGSKLPAASGYRVGSKQPTEPTTPTQPITGGMEQTAEQPTDVLSMLGLDEQSLMLLLALPVKEQNAILAELIGEKVKGGGTSAADKKRVAAVQQADVVYNQLEREALSAATGWGGAAGALFGKIPGISGGAAENLSRVTQGYAKSIASAFASEVGVATDRDVERWLGLMPKPGDTMQDRLNALARLKENMDAEKQRLGIQ